MREPPSGTVTFLFTDIEGSTRRWAQDSAAMRAALDVHDEVLRSAVEDNGGFLFKHTGDGICAAFSSGNAAVTAAVAAQLRLQLPVRMGLATGHAEPRDGDYFGPVLNRAARVMGAGSGGQILLSASTAGVVDGVDKRDLGAHRLRDLPDMEHLFQVRDAGLRTDFPPLRTADEVPGNLPLQTTAFIGRDTELRQVSELVRSHRLVTLTGVGGVGKSRLAIQVATELVADFPDGVWLVELAPVGDPASVPDAVATVLGVQSGQSASASLAQALSGRRLLIVLDNCEHVLDAAAALVETILSRALSVKVIATSREGLRVGSEHLWAVPSLETGGGVDSAAVALFVDRAQAVLSGFSLYDERDGAAVVEICRRLDGIALAIELAAARMVSMSPSELVERLTDRFRLLAGGRRGVERHQTLRHAVGWSYDLLRDDERAVLSRCAVFADGFDLKAATYVCSELDEYAVLDLLDSLVRKSLMVAEQAGGHTRYKMLETIRQYAEDQRGDNREARARHASYFAGQAAAYWAISDGPRQRETLDWVDVEFANLRAGFRWAADQAEIATAATIAAHTTMLAWLLQRYEPIGWVEELLAAATEANIRQLPRLYTAASICAFTGRPADALGYAENALRLEAQGTYDSFEPGWSHFCQVLAFRFLGEVEKLMDVCAGLTDRTGLARAVGLTMALYALPNAGQADQARAVAEDTVAMVRGRGIPWVIAWALNGYGRAFTETDPDRALTILRQGLEYAREHRLRLIEAFIARDVAALEAEGGDVDQALTLFASNIDSLHRTGSLTHLGSTIANLAVFFDRIDQAEIAATLYGATHHHATITRVAQLPAAVDHLRDVLGQAAFDRCLAAGAAMDSADVVQYAREQIQLARAAESPPQPETSGPSPNGVAMDRTAPGLVLPRSIDEVDASFMTEVLRSRGVIAGTNRVVHQEEADVGMTAGYFSSIKKVKCTYSEATNEPTCFVVKSWPPFELLPRDEIEAMFAKDINGYSFPPDNFFPRPHAYLATFDKQTDSWILVLEDADTIGVHKVHEFEMTADDVRHMIPKLVDVAVAWEGCDRDQKAEQLAEKGVDFWMAPGHLGDYKKYRQVMPAGAKLFDKLTTLEGSQLVGDRPWDKCLGGPGIAEMLATRLDAFFAPADPQHGATCTLCHGDLQGDNIFFCPPSDRFPDGWLCIDFQCMYRGPVASDLAYLMSSGSVLPEVYSGRSLHDILRTYYHEFMAKTQLYKDYRYETFLHEFVTMTTIIFINFVGMGAPIWREGAFSNAHGARIELGGRGATEADLSPEDVRKRMFWAKVIANLGSLYQEFGMFDYIKGLPENLEGLGEWTELPSHLR